MSVSVFEHSILQRLFSDQEFSSEFSVEEDLKTMLWYEAELAIALAKNNIIPEEAGDKISEACAEMSPDIEKLADSTFNDGVVVPELVRQIKICVGEDYARHVHFGATSQDVIDTSLILRLSRIIPKIDSYLLGLIKELEGLKTAYGQINMMAHTRMQQALEIQVSDKLQSWITPLETLKEDLKKVKADLLKLQLGGAVGTLHAFDDKADLVAKDLASQLELAYDGSCWHTNRLSLVSFTDWLSRLSGVLGKIGIDIVLLSQNEVRTIRLAKGGGSSAMPHKNNPVRAEILITLSNYLSTLTSSMHRSLVHENERSGSSWSLEWMVLPQMVAGVGGAMKNALILFQTISFHSQAK